MKKIIGKINPQDRHVSIWGAGFSGLVLGYFLKDQGYKVTIYEKSNRVGGKIRTEKTKMGLAESGPNALFLNQDGLEFLRDLKLEPIPAAKKLRRLLLINGKPRHPLQFGLFSKVAANALKKPPLISDGLTVQEFFQPLMGTENIHNYLSPALGGLYAASAQNLHFKSVFPHVEKKAQFESYWDFMSTLIKLKKAQPKLEISGSVTFEGGMQTLINRLAEKLKADIKLNYKEPFRLKGNTVICTDALSAAELLKEVRPTMSTELSRIHYQPLSSSTVFVKKEIRSLQRAFGVLIPLENGLHSIGVVNNKAIFPANNEAAASYTFISPKKLSKEEVIEDVKSLAPDISPEDVEHVESTYWDKAIPIYDLQLYLANKKLQQMGQKETTLALFGNYVGGIGLRDMISMAKNFARNPQDTVQ